MKFTLVSALAAGLLSAAPAFSGTVTLDFEGANSFGSISEFYNGGTDIPSTGTPASGTNYGVSFGLDALALANDSLGPYFSNAPSPGTVMTAVGPSAAMNSSAGFAGDVSFFYSSSSDTSVSIYDGLNGTGSVLATFTLTANAQNGCTDSPYCHWDQVSATFAGVAQSIQFGTAANVAGFDNLSFTPVPLPAAGWLLVSALGGMGAFRRRRTQA